MWRHYRKFFREMSEVSVYEVQSPTIPMAFFFPCQFRMTQAIFRNALQKNALKNFILNIHELKISIQARKKCHKDSVLLSLVILLFWLPFYVTTLKRGIWKDGRSPSSPSPVAFLSCLCEAPPPWQAWSTVWPLRARRCAPFLRSTYSPWGGPPNPSL